MKKMLTLAVLGVAAIFGMAANAQAQSTEPTLVANIPFDFTAGGAYFSAGTYEIRDVGGALVVRNVHGKCAVIVHTQHDYGRESVTRNRLDFQRENGTMRLTSVRSVGSDANNVLGN